MPHNRCRPGQRRAPPSSSEPINTSFNRHEEPIVCAPQNALGALEDGMVDLVVLGESLLVWRKGENAFARARFE